MPTSYTENLSFEIDHENIIYSIKKIRTYEQNIPTVENQFFIEDKKQRYFSSLNDAPFLIPTKDQLDDRNKYNDVSEATIINLANDAKLRFVFDYPTNPSTNKELNKEDVGAFNGLFNGVSYSLLDDYVQLNLGTVILKDGESEDRKVLNINRAFNGAFNKILNPHPKNKDYIDKKKSERWKWPNQVSGEIFSSIPKWISDNSVPGQGGLSFGFYLQFDPEVHVYDDCDKILYGNFPLDKCKYFIPYTTIARDIELGQWIPINVDTSYNNINTTNNGVAQQLQDAVTFPVNGFAQNFKDKKWQEFLPIITVKNKELFPNPKKVRIGEQYDDIISFKLTALMDTIKSRVKTKLKTDKDINIDLDSKTQTYRAVITITGAITDVDYFENWDNEFIFFNPKYENWTSDKGRKK